MNILLKYLLILGFINSLTAQNNSFVFNHLSTKDGLSQSTIMALHQDKLGQMWIGTRDGLNKYDGTKITIYRREIGNKNSISNDHIIAIEEDSEGYIWIGTFNGLNRYNPKTDKFTRYYQKENSLGNSSVWDIKELSDGNLWLATDNGISIFNRKQNIFNRYLHQPNVVMGLRVKCFLESKDNNIYIGTNEGLFRVKNKTANNIEFEKISAKTYFIQDIEETKSGLILLATMNSGLVAYNPTKKEYNNFLSNTNLPESLNNFRQLFFDEKERLWAATYKGLLIINPDNKTTYLKASIFNKKGLSKNSIRTLYKDNNGAMWVGTFYGGLNIWHPSNNNFKKITQNIKGYGLKNNVVSSMVEVNNNIYFGTEGGGITILNTKTKKYKYLTTKTSNLKGNNVKSLCVTKDNKLWLGIFKFGLQVYDLETKQFSTAQPSKELQDYIKGKNVYSIINDTKNSIWIGVFGKGVIKYNTKTKLFKNYWKSEKDSLSSDLVRTVFKDSDDNIWVGTERGLNKIIKDGTIKKYFYNEKEKYGEKILTIYQDKSKKIWVSVKSKGLYTLENNNFKSIELLPNTPLEPSIHNILEDNNNNLWLSTNQGIIKYQYVNKKITIFKKSNDGFVNREFNSNSSLKIGDSYLYFGGPGGVTYFDTNLLQNNTYAAKVILTNFKIRTTKQNSTGDLNTTLPYVKSIHLNHNQGNFTIFFSAPNFMNTNNTLYKYRLKGVENKWNTSTTPMASYTIQRSGDYTFEVKAANENGIWNEDITELQISVAAAPWLSWWAFLLYTIFASMLFYAYLRILKSRSDLKHKLELEQLEIEQTKTLNKKKIQFFTNISHDFKTPLALIIGPLQQIIENYSGNRETYNQLQVIEKNANILLQLINRLMDFRKLEKNIFKLEAAEGNIVKFLKETYLSFVEYAKIGKYTFEFNCDEDEIMVYYDRKKLERLFYNLISNAFKYTPKEGKIIVSIKIAKNTVLISIKDSGIGIKKAHLNKVFKRFFKINADNDVNTKYSKGAGIGLSIAKDIVKLHKGKIKVHSTGINNGTEFVVKLPLGKIHLKDSDIIKDFKYSDDVSQYVLKTDTTIEEKNLERFQQENMPTILLVEDNKQLRIFIKSLLIENYNVIEAENGEMAFSLAKSKLPDLIVSDVMMPKMTGTALCTAIKTELKTSHIPIILLTSRSALLYKLEGLEKGADDYLSKPFDVKEFKIRVNNLLKSREILRKKFQDIESFNDALPLGTSSDEKLYKKAVQIVKKNIGNDAFDIAFFASELGVSRTMLFNKIKAWSNYTPNEFINHFKMKKAAQLLEEGNLNISQVSYRIGFKTPKHFSKSFKKYYNQNPSEYASKFNSKTNT